MRTKCQKVNNHAHFYSAVARFLLFHLKLSLVSCPIALFPAATEREKISFHQLNKETGNRNRYRKVDAETGDEVPQDNIIKGYEVAKGEYIELDLKASPGRKTVRYSRACSYQWRAVAGLLHAPRAATAASIVG